MAAAPAEPVVVHPADPRPDRTLVIACGALARELLDAIALNGLTHMDVTGVPAKLHNRPEKIPAAVRAKIRAARRRHGYGRILVLYGDCGTGGALDRVLAEEGVERIPGDHCYAFYAGIERFDALHEAEPAAFYLTDYLVRHFDALIWNGLGLDRHPQLYEAYFGNYRRVVHLAQIPDPDLARKAERCAERLGLPLVTVATGFGLVQTFLVDDARPS